MVDHKAKPLPPQPSNLNIKDTKASRISKNVLDSLNSVKLKIAIFPTFHNLKDYEIEKKGPKGINIKNPQDFNLLIGKINSDKGHNIIIANTTELEKSVDFKDFDLLFNFSKFYFSNDNQYVFFVLGISRSKLAGSSAYYLLKKNNKKWDIEFIKEKFIW